MKTKRALSFFGGIAALAAVTVVASNLSHGESYCTYGGKSYSVGARVKQGDVCKECRENGGWWDRDCEGCTSAAPVGDSSGTGTCLFDGAGYGTGSVRNNAGTCQECLSNGTWRDRDCSACGEKPSAKKKSQSPAS
jgi:Protein of unknown function (DUF1496)